MADTIPNIKRREETVTYQCVECDDFELTKTFKGVRGTDGEPMFEDSGVDECPACGGEVEVERSDPNE
jgi:predicted RNA-binding Zn-ribbon protein involved in translation (DUF1610 family)